MNNKAADQTALVHSTSSSAPLLFTSNKLRFFHIKAHTESNNNKSDNRVCQKLGRINCGFDLLSSFHFACFCVFFTLILQFKDTYHRNEIDVSLYHESFIVSETTEAN